MFCLLLLALVSAQTDISDVDFPYCFQSFSGELTSSSPGFLSEISKDAEFKCLAECVVNPLCMTFSYNADSSSCLLFHSSWYYAFTALQAEESSVTEVAFRCDEQCSRKSQDSCETVVEAAKPCVLHNNNCVASCNNFVNENVLAQECLDTNAECSGSGSCVNSSFTGVDVPTASLSCFGGGSCENLVVYSVNSVTCESCAESTFDTIATLNATQLRSSNLINVDHLICEDCSFENSDVLTVEEITVSAPHGLSDVSVDMQSEVTTLTCAEDFACSNLHLNVDHLTCDATNADSPCAGNTFLAATANSKVLCLGENACAGTTFDGFAEVVCVHENSCDNALMLNVENAFCFVEQAHLKCDNLVSASAFRSCVAWTGTDCVTRQPSAAPTTTIPSFQPSFEPTHRPSTIPSVQPSKRPTIFVAVEAATRECLEHQWYDVNLATCAACPDGMEPSFTKLDCTRCGGNSAGTEGQCEECGKYLFAPNADATKCELNIVVLLLIVCVGVLLISVCRLWTRKPQVVDFKDDSKKTKKKKEQSSSGAKDGKKEKSKSHSKKRSMSVEKRDSKDEKASTKKQKVNDASPKKRSRSKSMEAGRKRNSMTKKEKRESVTKKAKRESSSKGKRDSVSKRESLSRKSSSVPREGKRKSLTRPSSSAQPSRKKSSDILAEARQLQSQSHGWRNWSPTQVAFFFNRQGLHTIASTFKDAGVTGPELESLRYDDLRELGFQSSEIRHFDAIMNVLQDN